MQKLYEYDRAEASAVVSHASAPLLEERIADIWREVLGLESISLEDNFFDLGGHSLLGAKVISRIRSEFWKDLPLRALFDAPALRDFVERVAGAAPSRTNPSDDGFDFLGSNVSRSHEAAPASAAQKRMWYLDQVAPNTAQYAISTAMRLYGRLNDDALQSALNAVVRRHETLGATMQLDTHGALVQVVHPEARVEIKRATVVPAPGEQPKDAVIRLLHEDAMRPFDLAKDIMLRAFLAQTSPLEHWLLLTVHHIASDGWSQGILLDELGAYYAAYSAGETPGPPKLLTRYADYADTQQRWLQSDLMEKQLAYWTKRLDGAPERIDLPTDRPRPAQPSHAGAARSITLPPPLLEALKALARAHDSTLYMTLLAAFHLLLARYSGQTDIVVGSPIAGRNRRETEGLIGLFVNTLALRTDLSGNPTFASLLQQVREMTLEAYAHQDLPFDRLVEALKPSRDSGYTPLFQVMFVLQNNIRPTLILPNIQTESVPMEERYAKFDLTLAAAETERGLEIDLQFATDFYDSATIERMLRHFQRLLESATATPNQKFMDLPMLSEDERRQLLAFGAGAETDYPRAASIHSLFETQAELHPNAIAAVFEDAQITYAELNARANQLAHFLIAAGARPGMLVGVMIERSLEMVVSLLAILKSGAAYAPLDASSPAERIASILDEDFIAVLVSQKYSDWKTQTPIRIISLDADAARIAECESRNPTTVVTGDDRAYLLYTSGSTGQPKGVEIPHRGVVRLVQNTDFLPFANSDVFLQFAPISFDASTLEIWGCLLNGGRLEIFPNYLPSLSELGAFIRTRRITTLWLTASLFQMMAADQIDDLRGVRFLLTGGDVVSSAGARRFLESAPGATIINGYGPTENTTFTTCYPMTHAHQAIDPLPIGRPIANTQVYVLTPNLQPAPIGVYGELYTGGDGLASGYRRQPELTAERFVPNPFRDEPQSRLYRTGDYVRWRPDGSLDFLGRIDHQVKIRGFRIELGEIEATLGKYSAIREAAAIVTQGETHGDKSIIAFFTSASGDAPGESDLRAFLSAHLPHYMIPRRCIALDAFPMTSSGKIDRHQLQRRPLPTATEKQAAPKSWDDTERRLAKLWSISLQVSSIGAQDNFFQLGGHSLLAIRLLTEIEREFQASLTLADILKAPTLQAMAHLLKDKQQGAKWSCLIPMRTYGTLPPLFCAPVGGGSAFYYRTLAARIGDDQPIYTFEPVGMSGTHEAHETVEEMAAYYLREMRAVQPNGPYHLCGLSFGGTVAFEMARQLRASGEQISSLILLDTYAPHAVDALSPKNQSALGAVRYAMQFHWENFRACRPEARLPYVYTQIVKLTDRVVRSRGKVWGSGNGNPALREMPEVFQKVSDAEARARERYHPTPYDGDLLLLKARLQEHDSDALMGWRAFATRITVIETPGSHYSLLETPCVDITIGHLRRALAEERL